MQEREEPRVRLRVRANIFKYIIYTVQSEMVANGYTKIALCAGFGSATLDDTCGRGALGAGVAAHSWLALLLQSHEKMHRQEWWCGSIGSCPAHGQGRSQCGAVEHGTEHGWAATGWGACMHTLRLA